MIGTTGLGTHARVAMEVAARPRSRSFSRANYSVGINVMLKLIADAARALGPDYDIEVSRLTTGPSATPRRGRRCGWPRRWPRRPAAICRPPRATPATATSAPAPAARSASRPSAAATWSATTPSSSSAGRPHRGHPPRHQPRHLRGRRRPRRALADRQALRHLRHARRARPLADRATRFGDVQAEVRRRRACGRLRLPRPGAAGRDGARDQDFRRGARPGPRSRPGAGHRRIGARRQGAPQRAAPAGMERVGRRGRGLPPAHRARQRRSDHGVGGVAPDRSPPGVRQCDQQVGRHGGDDGAVSGGRARWLEDALGQAADRHLVFTTDPGQGALREIAGRGRDRHARGSARCRRAVQRAVAGGPAAGGAGGHRHRCAAGGRRVARWSAPRPTTCARTPPRSTPRCTGRPTPSWARECTC